MPCHLSIERETSNSKANQHAPSDNISKMLFAGTRDHKDHKGYQWLVSFLSIMHKIRFTSHQSSSSNKELIMTKYMLKLLTILSNILVSNLLILDAIRTDSYVSTLTSALKDSPLKKIQTIRPLDSSNSDAFFVGCSLLKELAFTFVSHVKEFVPDAKL